MTESGQSGDHPKNTPSLATVEPIVVDDAYKRACRDAYARGYQAAIKVIRAVAEQLRDETKYRFAKNDRVKLSTVGIEILTSDNRRLSMPADRNGTVVYNSRNPQSKVAVRWDGMKTPQYISTVLLERADD
jgi:hypothetical protein